jgi:hypothetical protein
MAETKRYQYFAIVDKPNHPDEPQRKPHRTTYIFKNTTGGTDPKTGEIVRAECKGIDPSSTGIYTVDMESTDAKLKVAALEKAVREGIGNVIGPFDTMAQVVMEQKARQPLTVKEQLARSQEREKEKDARIKELELRNKEKTQGDR